jgi:lipoic acid synthetase
VRGRKSDYRWTLAIFNRIRKIAPSIRTKSGLMLGLGETRDELFEVFADLRAAGCKTLTLGQYLQPTPEHLPVERFVPPSEFDDLRLRALSLGFTHVASGPFVRSSYHAREMMVQ